MAARIAKERKEEEERLERVKGLWDKRVQGEEIDAPTRQEQHQREKESKEKIRPDVVEETEGERKRRKRGKAMLASSLILCMVSTFYIYFKASTHTMIREQTETEKAIRHQVDETRERRRLEKKGKSDNIDKSPTPAPTLAPTSAPPQRKFVKKALTNNELAEKERKSFFSFSRDQTTSPKPTTSKEEDATASSNATTSKKLIVAATVVGLAGAVAAVFSSRR